MMMHGCAANGPGICVLRLHKVECMKTFRMPKQDLMKVNISKFFIEIIELRVLEIRLLP